MRATAAMKTHSVVGENLASLGVVKQRMCVAIRRECNCHEETTTTTEAFAASNMLAFFLLEQDTTAHC